MNIKTHLLSFFILTLVFVPVLIGAQTTGPGNPQDAGYLIVCDGPDCGYDDFILLISRLFNFLMYAATFLAVLGFIISGFRLLTSQGNPSALGKAKDMAMSILKGYAAILLAWVIVYTILNALVKTDYSLLKN